MADRSQVPPTEWNDKESIAVFAGKPIIGIAGGIGSGKSFIANLFGELGCLVLSSDEHVAEAYGDSVVKEMLRKWWGDQVMDKCGEVDRKALARLIFEDGGARQRLEGLIHPWVKARRQALMEASAGDLAVKAYVWDVPLLFETHQEGLCDAVVFVEATLEQRLARVRQIRGWDGEELERREKLQLALDNKRRMSKYMVLNTADVGFARRQVEAVLTDILAKSE